MFLCHLFFLFCLHLHNPICHPSATPAQAILDRERATARALTKRLEDAEAAAATLELERDEANARARSMGRSLAARDRDMEALTAELEALRSTVTGVAPTATTAGSGSALGIPLGTGVDDDDGSGEGRSTADDVACDESFALFACCCWGRQFNQCDRAHAPTKAQIRRSGTRSC